jgi:hypothetical protein
MNLKTKKFCEYCPRLFDFFIKTFLLFEKVFWLCCCCCCSLTSFQEKEFFCQHKMDEWTKMTIYLFTFFYNPKWRKDIWQNDTWLNGMLHFVSMCRCVSICRIKYVRMVLIDNSLSLLSLSLFLSLFDSTL